MTTSIAQGDHLEVGIRELERRRSEYLERAARGEVIRVPDRGRPEAILAPPPEGPRLDAGIADGWIRPGAEIPPRPAPRQRAACRVLDVLSEDRGG